MTANIDNKKRKTVYIRDGYRCALCDSTQYIQIHHVIPRGEGGTNNVQNLIKLCPYCNSHVHGVPLYDTDVTAEEMAQLCVEYLADLYAEEGVIWCPF